MERLGVVMYGIAGLARKKGKDGQNDKSGHYR